MRNKKVMAENEKIIGGLFVLVRKEHEHWTHILGHEYMFKKKIVKEMPRIKELLLQHIDAHKYYIKKKELVWETML